MDYLRIFLIVIVVMWALNSVLSVSRPAVQGGNGNVWKVFGSMNCGWTRKQVEELKNKGVPYEFLDCSGDRCSEGMPENILPNGTRRVGFTKVD